MEVFRNFFVSTPRNRRPSLSSILLGAGKKRHTQKPYSMSAWPFIGVMTGVVAAAALIGVGISKWTASWREADGDDSTSATSTQNSLPDMPPTPIAQLVVQPNTPPVMPEQPAQQNFDNVPEIWKEAVKNGAAQPHLEDLLNKEDDPRCRDFGRLQEFLLYIVKNPGPDTVDTQLPRAGLRLMRQMVKNYPGHKNSQKFRRFENIIDGFSDINNQECFMMCRNNHVFAILRDPNKEGAGCLLRKFDSSETQIQTYQDSNDDFLGNYHDEVNNIEEPAMKSFSKTYYAEGIRENIINSFNWQSDPQNSTHYEKQKGPTCWISCLLLVARDTLGDEFKTVFGDEIDRLGCPPIKS